MNCKNTKTFSINNLINPLGTNANFFQKGILKCVLIKEKFLQPDGQFGNEEEFKAFVDSWIPSNLLEAVMPKFTRCKEISG